MAQAIDALRHGWPIGFADGPVLLPVETGLAERASGQRLLISDARAQTLKLTNQRAAAQAHAPVLIEAAIGLRLADALPIADPSLDLAHPFKGPFRALATVPYEQAFAAALELARLAGILPAFLVDAEQAGEPVWLEQGDLQAWQPAGDLAIATRARLPVSATAAQGEKLESEIIAFRAPNDLREHSALVIGAQTSEQVPLVRVHSECLTGDVFGSLKCDCGPQLDAALDAMAQEADTQTGWGILLYLRQEGRGIGLINKLRAYRLQDQGFDTVDANRRLGLPDEARDFEVASAMLNLLGVDQVRLMTNNPAKVEALSSAGIGVIERVPHALPDNPHNRKYLATKRDRSGHILP